MICLTWNADSLGSFGKELALSNMLADNNVDIVAITEVEYTATDAPFALEGYTTFLPLVEVGAKTRVLLLVRTTLATEANAILRKDLMTTSVASIWVELGPHVRNVGGRTAAHAGLLFCAIYRQWENTLDEEREGLDVFIDQLDRAMTHRSVSVMGDLNVDNHRKEDKGYYRRTLADVLTAATERNGLECAVTPWTWKSYGKFGGSEQKEHRKACLDHVYFAGINAVVKVLKDATSDHRPVVMHVSSISSNSAAGSRTIMRRNVKNLTREALESALQGTDWSEVHKIKDAESVHAFVVRGINAALDLVAPFKPMRVKSGGRELYLAKDTLDCIRYRNHARENDLDTFKYYRNRATVLVARDKRDSNMSKLVRSSNDSKLLWQIANAALGKDRPSLPKAVRRTDGSMTASDLEAATVLNESYVSKVLRLRSANAGSTPATTAAWPSSRAQFNFSFASAGKVVKIVRGLKPTEALGVDNIPVSVLKKAIDVLAAPIAHLCNVSLATGVVPSGLKLGKITPVFKGSGKDRLDPASYRPVSILASLSKVLEILVKSDLEGHLRKTNGLPTTQFGFRSNRGCSTALGTAHAGWIKASRAGIVGTMSYDLSCAFDTIDVEQLLPKLEKLGIKGTALSWMRSYMTGGRQCVMWNETASDFIVVLFGVRQGSILGPILFLVLLADLPDYLGNGGKDNNVIYADDIDTWQSGRTMGEVADKLTRMAERVVSYARGNGLALNAAKTQLMYSGGGEGLPVMVDGVKIQPGKTIELLGATFDRKLTTAPHDCKVAAAAKQRASLVARLGHHLPQGRYLRALSMGLFTGKISHALAAVATPRLDSGSAANSSYKAVQVSMNDVARTLTGSKRADHVPVAELLAAANMPSVNYLVTVATAMTAWSCFHSNDGQDGARNPLGMAIFGSDNVRSTRASEAGHTHIELRGVNTLASNAGKIWNASPALRLALTKGEANTAARALARTVPL